MKNNIGLIGVMARMFLSGSSRSGKKQKLKENENYGCDSHGITGIKECYPQSKQNTYTEFIPNPENNNFRKKYLGVKKKGFKKS